MSYIVVTPTVAEGIRSYELNGSLEQRFGSDYDFKYELNRDLFAKADALVCDLAERSLDGYGWCVRSDKPLLVVHRHPSVGNRGIVRGSRLKEAATHYCSYSRHKDKSIEVQGLVDGLGTLLTKRDLPIVGFTGECIGTFEKLPKNRSVSYELELSYRLVSFELSKGVPDYVQVVVCDPRELKDGFPYFPQPLVVASEGRADIEDVARGGKFRRTGHETAHERYANLQSILEQFVKLSSGGE